MHEWEDISSLIIRCLLSAELSQKTGDRFEFFHFFSLPEERALAGHTQEPDEVSQVGLFILCDLQDADRLFLGVISRMCSGRLPSKRISFPSSQCSAITRSNSSRSVYSWSRKTKLFISFSMSNQLSHLLANLL